VSHQALAASALLTVACFLSAKRCSVFPVLAALLDKRHLINACIFDALWMGAQLFVPL
jgi:hypothetical protein